MSEELHASPSGPAQPDDPVILAGGGVVWRPAGGDRREVVIVHRPKYGDWSLPKGKCDRGEGQLDAAVREVEEESGLRCRAGSELPPSQYVDRKGRPKQVRWWVMTVEAGEAAAANEVDEVRWVALDEVRHQLSHQRDVAVIDAFEALPAE